MKYQTQGAALKKLFVFALPLVIAISTMAQAQSCIGSKIAGISGLSGARQLDDGTLLGRAKANVNIDGYGRAYHPLNATVGALIHLCNAGKVYLPNGTSYHGSESNPTCTGKFMTDFAAIKKAGWTDPNVGAIEWYGILGEGAVKIAGSTISSVVPVEIADGSGFYVSPTAFADHRVSDPRRQDRYVDPLKVRAAVVPNQKALRDAGVKMGSFGVAYDPRTGKAVPFVVGDIGPKVGEATPKLLRDMAGLPHKDPITRAGRFDGQVSEARILWVLFGSARGAVAYDAADPAAANTAAEAAFQDWGGISRLKTCL